PEESPYLGPPLSLWLRHDSLAISPEGRGHPPHLDRRIVMSVAERPHRLPVLRRGRDLAGEGWIGEHDRLSAEAPALWSETNHLLEVGPRGVGPAAPVQMRADPEVRVRESLASRRARHPPLDLFGRECMLAPHPLRDPVAERIDVDPPAALVVGGRLRGHLE